MEILMRKISGLLAILVILGSSTSIFSGESGLLGKRYASAGFSVASVDGYDADTNSLNGAINVPVDKNADILVSGGYSWYEQGNLKLKSKTIMSTLLYRFHTPSMVTPYIGAGVGMVFTKAEVNFFGGSLTSSDSNFLYSGLIGVQLEPFEKTRIDLGYSVVVVDARSSSSISSEFGYWFTPMFSLDFGLGYNSEDEITVYGVSGNFLF